VADAFQGHAQAFIANPRANKTLILPYHPKAFDCIGAE